MIGILGAAAIVVQPADPGSFAEPDFISRTPVHARIKVSGPFARMARMIEISAAERGDGRPSEDYWTAVGMFQLGDKIWSSTNSDSCPGLGRVVAQLNALPTMTLHPPERGEPPPPPLDGATYEVAVNGRFGDDLGRTTLGSYGDPSPLSEWVDSAFDALGSCWVKGEGPPSKDE